MNFNSRYNEFAADRYAQSLGMADALGRGLVKISVGEKERFPIEQKIPVTVPIAFIFFFSCFICEVITD